MKYLFYGLALCLVIAAGCQKELSYEGNGDPAKGSLQSAITGDCLPKTVNGIYEANKALDPDSNTITVSVNVMTAGTYSITTDTINGYFFRGSGIFTTPGNNNVTLRGNGTPFAEGVNTFIVSFDSTVCTIQVTVLPEGASGPSTFTLVNGGTPPNCASAVVNGTYIKDQPVSAANTVDISVDVTTIGAYSIAASGGGLTFIGTGNFTTTGQQIVTLAASGTPTTLGANTITFDPPFDACSFEVTVVQGAEFSMDCGSAVVNGTYQTGTALDASNTVTISVNVTTAGPYNIVTTATNGMVFSATGTFATTGIVSVTLIGSGTPTIDETSHIPVPGTAPCTFDVVVDPSAPASGTWTFKENGTTYSGTTNPGSFMDVGPVKVYQVSGTDTNGNNFSFNLGDFSGNITSGEIYNTNTSNSNNASFLFSIISSGTSWSADPSKPSVNIKFENIVHNTSTKTITGTFSGTVEDDASAVHNITEGSFSTSY